MEQHMNENLANRDVLALQQGYSYYGCQFIYQLSQHMIPLRVLPAERGRYPSVRDKVVSSAMRFFHYATTDTILPSSTVIIKSLIQSRDLDLRVGPPGPPDLFYWRSVTIKIPEQRQNLAHAGEHLDSALNEAFFLQAGINNSDSRDIDRIRSIARAFINDWYFSPFSGDLSRFDPKQTAVCAVFTARICLGGKLRICPQLLISWNVGVVDLTDWANLIFKFYEVSSNIVTGNKDLQRKPGWISVNAGEATSHGLQVWDILDLKNN